jgi:hypothetical protein
MQRPGFYRHGDTLDKRLNNAMDGIASLSLEVQRGGFLEKLPPGMEKTWMCNGLVLASSVLEPEESSSDRQSNPFTTVTPHVCEAGVLLDRIRELFMPLLDECIEHDFFDRIGEAALEYSGYADRADQTAVNLLKILLAEAESILEEMREGEFPFTTNGSSVLAGRRD